MTCIKDRARQVMTLYDTNDPYKIASQEKILILFDDLVNTMGYFHTSRRIRLIHINKNLSELLQRFTCAHELAHAILHPNVNTPFLKAHTLQSIDRIEREANQFAVELLIPDILLLEGMTIYEAAAACGVPAEIAHLKSKPEKCKGFWNGSSFINF